MFGHVKALCVVAVGGLAALAQAGVSVPPPFPPTSPGFTCQSWEFLTPSTPTPPDPGFINPFGFPTMRVKGQPEWLPVFPPPPNPSLKEGVWCLTNSTGVPDADSLNFLIPNANSAVDQKEIVVYTKWFGAAAQGFGPGYQLNLPGSTVPIVGQPFSREPIDPQNHPGWFLDCVRFNLDFCPPFEEIKVGAFDVPPGVNVYVDWVTIYTRCVPTPGAAGLAALAGLAVIRRRRA